MIPASDCPCDTGPEVCCDTLFLKGDRIRTVAWNAVRACSDEGCCSETVGHTYTTVGPQIADHVGDSVIVALAEFGEVTVTSGGHSRQIGPHRAEFRVEIRSTGWPIVRTDAGRIFTPTAANYNAASKHAMGHAEKAYRAVVDGVQRQTLFPSASNTDVIFKGQRYSTIRPLQPAAYIVGFAFAVTVDITLSPPG